MAKRAELPAEETEQFFDDAPAKAEQPQSEGKKKNKPPNFPVGVYLTESEKAEIQDIADKEGIKRHALLQYAIRLFVAGYKSGDLKIETKTVKVLDPPK